jgi:PAS domain S-box-containing protein
MVFAAVALVAYLVAEVTRTVHRRSRDAAVDAAQRAEVFLVNAEDHLRHSLAMAETEELGPHLQHYLDLVVRDSRIFDSILLLDREGETVRIGLTEALQGRRGEFLGQSYRYQPVFGAARRSRSPLWADSFMSPLDGRISTALFLPGERWTMLANLRPGFLGQFTARPRAEGPHILFLDRKGTVVASNYPPDVQPRVHLGHVPPVREALPGVPVTGVFRHDARSYLGTGIRIPRVEWVVLVEEELRAAYRPVTSAILILGTGSLLALVLTLFLTLRRTGGLSRPLLELTARVRQLEEGSDPEVMEPSGYQEIDILAGSFRKMTLAIKDREDQISRSREMYQRLVESTHAVPWELDLEDNRFTFVGPQLERVFGRRHQAWVTLDDWTASLHSDDRQATLDYRLRMTAQGLDHQLEYRLVGEDGRIRWVYDMTYVQKEGERPVKLLGFLLDITPLKDAEEEKQRLQQQVLHSQKLESLGILAGGVAHDFNNVLGAILGYAQLCLLDARPGSSAHEYLTNILQAVERAKGIVHQILAFSRKDSEGRRPVLVQEVLGEALTFLRASIPSTITMKVEVDPDCEPVLADPNQIHQVIVNLITNAYQAMREKGGVLLVRLERGVTLPPPHRTGGRGLRLTVADTGPGMDQAVVARIFEPYFTTKPVGEGTGLGLSLVYGIVKSHRGYVTVESQPGAGSTFAFYLATVDQAPASRGEPAAESPRGSERILLVDDEERLLNAWKELLAGLGYRVTATANPGDALRIFSGDPAAFDLLITDQTMPVMTGVELVEALRRERPGFPAVICSGYSDRRDSARGRDPDGYTFLDKPLRLDQLAVTIRQVLAGHGPAAPTDPGGTS